MTDYGRDVEFGISLAPNASELDVIFAAVEEADRGLLDLIGIQDHPYQRRFLDTMQLLGAVVQETERVRVFPDVACLPLRPPAILANQAASIDIISGGRFELGLGAGAFWDAIVGMGGPRRTPAEALAALQEAVDVIRLLWSGEKGITYEGAHYQIAGIHSGPVPAHDVEIWFGVYGPKACRMLGHMADGWLPSLGRTTLDEVATRQRIIDESAEEAGRRPEEIRRLVNVGGSITKGESSGFLNGPAEQWIDQVTELTVEHGFDTYIFWPEGDVMSQIAQFTEVAEAVRESVARARA